MTVWGVDPRCERRLVEQHWFVLGKLLLYFNAGNHPFYETDFNKIMMTYLKNKEAYSHPPRTSWVADSNPPPTRS